MFICAEDQKLNNIKVLVGFISRYGEYKNFIDEATEQEKQSPKYEHQKQIVEGVDKFYPLLNKEMKQVYDLFFREGITDFADIGDEIYSSTHRAKRLFNVMIEKFGNTIGWY